MDSSTETLPLLPGTEVSQQQQQQRLVHLSAHAWIHCGVLSLYISVSPLRDSNGLAETLSHVVSTEESSLVTAGDIPPPPAYKVNKVGTDGDVTPLLFSSSLTSLAL